MRLQMSFGFSLTVSVCPLLKWISVPFPFRVMYSIAFKLISWPDFQTLISRFSVAMFSLIKAQFISNMTPISKIVGDGTRDRGRALRRGAQRAVPV